MNQGEALTADRRSIPDEVAALLREEILDGLHTPSTLLKQGHLAHRFGTSQGPIREAFRRLEAENLVVFHLNRGVRVSSLEVTEVEELGALRLSLEPELVALAATCPEAVDVASARSAIGQMRSVATPAALMAANAEFHDAVYSAANRPITLELVQRLRARFERALRLMWRMTGCAALSNDEHEEILCLVLSGDAETVRQVMARHVGRSTLQILEVLRQAETRAHSSP